MHPLILAGGEGNRLAADGVTPPKALVPVAGKPQIEHLIEALEPAARAGIWCLVREDFPEVLELLRRRQGISLIPCRTPSSLHTLVQGLAAIPEGPVFCTMVDTVMPAADWRRVVSAVRSALASGADLVLAVTPYVDDERALYVARDPAGTIVEISDTPLDPPCVTGGVYGLAARARALAAEALHEGRERLRAFLKLAVERRLQVVSVEVPRIVDLDRRRDLEVADAWLTFRKSPSPSRRESP